MRETDYPFVSGNDAKKHNCRPILDHQGVTTIRDAKKVSIDVKSIKAALSKGPVSVTLSFGNDVFRLYKAGIISASDGCEGAPDHAAVIVGWSINKNGVEYYIVKNSFGNSWGEGGYFRIEITDGEGTCRINRNVWFVTL